MFCELLKYFLPILENYWFSKGMKPADIMEKGYSPVASNNLLKFSEYRSNTTRDIGVTHFFGQLSKRNRSWAMLSIFYSVM